MSAQQLAQEKGQQQVDALHLLYALLSQDGSVVQTVLAKMGADVEDLKQKTAALLERLPRSTSPAVFGQFYLTQDLARILERARVEAGKMGDEYVSGEHLLLALVDVETKAKEVLERTHLVQGGKDAATLEFAKLDYDTVLKVLAEIRGGVRITDPTPESKYQVIERYTKNLTRLAELGKLDPVIGREQEIRRLMQVLSRRTKNNPLLIL